MRRWKRSLRNGVTGICISTISFLSNYILFTRRGFCRVFVFPRPSSWRAPGKYLPQLCQFYIVIDFLNRYRTRRWTFIGPLELSQGTTFEVAGYSVFDGDQTNHNSTNPSPLLTFSIDIDLGYGLLQPPLLQRIPPTYLFCILGSTAGPRNQY
jgi:hypothetical protein